MKLFWMFLLLMICSGASEQAISQWASFFAESALQVSKTAGDLLGPCAFAILMGLSRTFFEKYGARINLKKFIVISSVLCVASYLTAALSSSPLLALGGCALCPAFSYPDAGSRCFAAQEELPGLTFASYVN